MLMKSRQSACGADCGDSAGSFCPEGGALVRGAAEQVPLDTGAPSEDDDGTLDLTVLALDCSVFCRGLASIPCFGVTLGRMPRSAFP
jgi:hypothetical protein